MGWNSFLDGFPILIFLFPSSSKPRTNTGTLLLGLFHVVDVNSYFWTEAGGTWKPHEPTASRTSQGDLQRSSRQDSP